jgi:hypothetical protein
MADWGQALGAGLTAFGSGMTGGNPMAAGMDYLKQRDSMADKERESQIIKGVFGAKMGDQSNASDPLAVADGGTSQATPSGGNTGMGGVISYFKKNNIPLPQTMPELKTFLEVNALEGKDLEKQYNLLIKQGELQKQGTDAAKAQKDLSPTGFDMRISRNLGIHPQQVNDDLRNEHIKIVNMFAEEGNQVALGDDITLMLTKMKGSTPEEKADNYRKAMKIADDLTFENYHGIPREEAMAQMQAQSQAQNQPQPAPTGQAAPTATPATTGTATPAGQSAPAEQAGPNQPAGQTSEQGGGIVQEANEYIAFLDQQVKAGKMSKAKAAKMYKTLYEK